MSTQQATFFQSGVSPSDPNNLLPTLVRDAVITPGTRFVIDVLDTYCYGGGDWKPGQAMKNLVDDYGDTATPGTATQAFDSGIEFTAIDSTQKITLPQSSVLSSASKGWSYCNWIKWKTASPSGNLAISGTSFATPGSVNQLFALYFNSGSGKIAGIAGGWLSDIGTLADGQIVQAGIAIRVTGTNSFERRYYLNGVRVATSVAASALPAFAPPASNLIGVSAGLTAGASFEFYRAWLDEPGVGGVESDDLFALDYAQNNGRFS